VTGGKVAEGRVCTQDPAALSKQTKDTKITFKLYKKPTVQVPPVIGLQYAQAASTLTSKGLKPTRKDVNSDKPVGEVTGQAPREYTVVATGETITLSVSNGKSGVPTLVGKQLDAARQLLSQQGWTTPPKVNYRTTHDQSLNGVVLEQFPAPNTSYLKDQQITLTVWQYSAPSPSCTTPTTSPKTSPSTSPPTSPTTSPPTSPIITPQNLAPPTGTGTGTGSALPPCH
jgi:serine/threonine-protein kinase